MCLITFAYHCHPDYPLIVLANRDEFYARPSDLLAYWEDEPSVLAGRDKQLSGTWLGLNKAGLFTAVTNYRDGTNTASDRRSRGDLTRNFLCAKKTASCYIEELAPHQHQFGDYNLLLGDSTGLYYCSNRAPNSQKLSPGIYGLSNALLNTPWPKLEYVKAKLAEVLNNTELNTKTLPIDTLLTIMSDRAEAPLEERPDTGISAAWEKLLSSAFIQTENYGTRATTLILQKTNGDTQIIEQSFDANGPIERRNYSLNIPVIG